MNQEIPHYVYVLVSEVNDSTYIGLTDDLERRLAEHNRGGTSSIRKSVPFRVHYFETYSSRTRARKRELQLTKSRWHKKELFNRIFPQESSISAKGWLQKGWHIVQCWPFVSYEPGKKALYWILLQPAACRCHTV